MLIERITAPGMATGSWPATIPAVGQIIAEGLDLTAPVTFLVGENGSGKSTIVEAIAEAYGINTRGGRGRKDKPAVNSPLGKAIDFDLTADGHRLSRRRNRSRSYFLRAETAFDFLEFISSFNIIVPGYPQDDLRTLSHGEGYLALFAEVLSEPGLYLMDEPEAALSFTSCLHLVRTLHEVGKHGAQVICATHSPILAATPGADILELTDAGISRTTWNDLTLVDHWRRYLSDPTAYLHHLID